MRPLALLHGFTGTPRAWDAVIAALPAEADAVCPAIVGHDHELALTGGRFEDEVDRLARVLASQSSRRFHLAGYSLGGRLALGLLVRHQGLFASATLIGAHPGLEKEEARRERSTADELLAKKLAEQGVEGFIEHWEQLPLFASQKTLTPEARESQRRQRLSHRAAGLAHALRILSLGRMPNYREDLGRIDLPIRLMVGETDAKFCQLAETMAASLPTATVRVVSGAGHNLLLEAPGVVASVIAEDSGAE